ncbi:MAG: vitamin K epoxide reductase family protein [Verrucomicrobiota bacterium]
MASHIAKPSLSHTLLIWTRVLLLGAIAISSYLLWVSLSGGNVAGCGAESNCHKVLNSRWAYWFGFPVSGLALAVYLAVLTASFGLSARAPAKKQRQAWIVLFSGSLLILLAAVWFIALQALVIRSFCFFCLGAHALGLTVAVLLLRHAPVRSAPEKAALREKEIFLTRDQARSLGLAAAAGLAVLLAGQWLVKPPAPIVSAALEPARTAPPAAPNRPFEIFGGAFKFNLHDVPIFGRPDAPYVMVSLFDFTCHHCRAQHGRLAEAQKGYSNQLAIVSLPMPLNADCNPVLQRTPSTHVAACDLARLGLSVWRAKREAFPEFVDWIFAPASPPPVSAARERAAQLVTPERLTTAQSDPWVEEHLRLSTSLYHTNLLRSGRSTMPQLILDGNLILGEIRSVQELTQLIDKYLVLKTSAPAAK